MLFSHSGIGSLYWNGIVGIQGIAVDWICMLLPMVVINFFRTYTKKCARWLIVFWLPYFRWLNRTARTWMSRLSIHMKSRSRANSRSTCPRCGLSFRTNVAVNTSRQLHFFDEYYHIADNFGQWLEVKPWFVHKKCIENDTMFMEALM